MRNPLYNSKKKEFFAYSCTQGQEAHVEIDTVRRCPDCKHIVIRSVAEDRKYKQLLKYCKKAVTEGTATPLIHLAVSKIDKRFE